MVCYDGSQIGPPTLVAPTPEDCYVLAAGGTVAGKADADLLLVLSASTLYDETRVSRPKEATLSPPSDGPQHRGETS